MRVIAFCYVCSEVSVPQSSCNNFNIVFSCILFYIVSNFFLTFDFPFKTGNVVLHVNAVFLTCVDLFLRIHSLFLKFQTFPTKSSQLACSPVWFVSCFLPCVPQFFSVRLLYGCSGCCPLRRCSRCHCGLLLTVCLCPDCLCSQWSLPESSAFFLMFFFSC